MSLASFLLIIPLGNYLPLFVTWIYWLISNEYDMAEIMEYHFHD